MTRRPPTVHVRDSARERARAHLASGRGGAALAVLSDHLARDPGDPGAWDDAAEVMLHLGHAASAVDAARQAYTRGRTLDAAALVAVALASCGRNDQALALVHSVIGASPSDPTTWERIARAFERLGEVDAGLAARNEAQRLAPADRGVALRLAERLERADRRDEARQIAVELGEGGRRLLVRLDHHDGALDAAAAGARSLLAAPDLADPSRVSLLMELARIEARRGSPSAAFEAARQGNALALALWQADGGDVDKLPRALGHLLQRPVSRPPPAADPPPGMAFVVGFPRSGTTLVQQFLEAHPGTCTLEEVPLVDTAVEEVLPGVELARAVELAGDPAVARRIADRWWAGVRARTSVDGRLVVDKLPLNLLRVELLARVFPGAPIVAVVRDPRDAVLSAFLQDFELNAAMAQCADLVRCATLYATAFRLWTRVRDALPCAIELRYEALVRDPEAALRPVIAALGLPWDPAVRDHRAAAGRSIGTPSYRDVRKPVHPGQIGRWRAFEAELAPALPILAPFAAAFGYEVAAPEPGR